MESAFASVSTFLLSRRYFLIECRDTPLRSLRASTASKTMSPIVKGLALARGVFAEHLPDAFNLLGVLNVLGAFKDRGVFKVDLGILRDFAGVLGVLGVLGVFGTRVMLAVSSGCPNASVSTSARVNMRVFIRDPRLPEAE